MVVSFAVVSFKYRYSCIVGFEGQPGSGHPVEKDETMASTERKKLWTPPFRVSFPSVFEASSYQGSKPKYSVVGLWYPAKFDAKQKEVAPWPECHTSPRRASAG